VAVRETNFIDAYAVTIPFQVNINNALVREDATSYLYGAAF